MARRSAGQLGNIVVAGKWIRLRFRLDQVGTEAMRQMSIPICPASGPERLSKEKIEQRRLEILAEHQVNSKERFQKVVLGEITFRQQAEKYLAEAATRNRKPLRDTTAIRSVLAKWAYPTLGDTLLSQVKNSTVAPVVRRMVDAGLSPRSVNKYFEYIAAVVASHTDDEGERIIKIDWSPEKLDLPVLDTAKQLRPSIKVEPVSALIAAAEPFSQEQALYVLLGAAELRISEALGIEVKHFINSYRTVLIEQQVQKYHPRITDKLKNSTAYRQIDFHPDIAAYFRRYTEGKTGLLFQTREGTPHLYGNLAKRWLIPRLVKLA